MKMNVKRTMVIGLDGATFDLMRPWVQQGILPNLQTIMQKGSYGELESTAFPVSAVAWSSYFTGTNPGKHGIFAFRNLKLGSYDLEFANGSHVKSKTLWKIFSEHDKSVIVVNIPMTYPPEKVKGVLVSGMDAPGIESNFIHPPELKEELLKNIPDYNISLHLMGALNEDDDKRAKAAEDILNLIDARKKAVQYLADNYSWDLISVRFNCPDTAQHHFWKYMDPSHPDYEENSRFSDFIKRVYVKLDKTVGELMELADPETTVIVMSDHGAGSRIPKAVYLNEWLWRKKMLTPAKSKKSGKRLFTEAVDKIFRIMLRQLSYKSKDWLRFNVPSFSAKVASYLRFSGIDWSNTKAFVAETANIRINLKGREPQGIVEPGEEYEEVRNFIIKELEGLVDLDTNERVFTEIQRREDIFHGPCLESAPDILVSTRDYAYAVSQKFFRKQRDSVIIHEPHWRGTSGRHRKNGIFIMTGPNINKNVEINGSQIIDVAPTILYQMGIPIPRWMDGKILSDCFDPNFMKSYSPLYTEGKEESENMIQSSDNVYSEDEAEVIKERLQDLGYIE